LIELVIDSIRVGLRHYRRVVVLKEKDADRYLPIWIGPDVADAIAFHLQEVTVPRPQTHDLLAQVIGELGGTVVSVVVNDLKDDTFFAKINVEHDGQTIEIDSRPSDAIALAVRAEVPIFVADEVIERVGVTLDDEGQPIEGAGAEVSTPATEEELEKLSVFRDFVSGLDLDDLGSHAEQAD
jgi:bifunctional DNase/RNase